jgi:Carboxypeptidase regulatory-like domain
MNSQTVRPTTSRLENLIRGIGFACACLGLLFISIPSYSQGNTGRILGTVTDPSGGTIPGATVTVTDVQRGLTRTLITDAAGAYAAPNLLPGNYAVRAEAKGFSPLERKGLSLEVGKDVRVDLTLQPGGLTQVVTVTEAAPLVETTNATLGGTLSNQTINELPLNGRNFENLLSLRPGVTNFVGGGAWTQSTNGVRPEDNVFLLDGLNDDEAYAGLSIVNLATLAGDATTILPIDAIQEFNTEENPKAEYGWKPGATVVVGLKSGTNSFHGTAYAFGRSDAFDARDFFNFAPDPKAPVGLEQFGASAGGPIKKDKLFWFAAFEQQRYSVGSTFSTTAPAKVNLPNAGNCLVSGFSGDCANSISDACNDVGYAKVTPLSAHLAGLNSDCSVKPAITTPGQDGSMFPDTQGATNNLPLNSVSNNLTSNGLAKIDYHVNDRHSLNGMFFFGQDNGNFNDAPNEVLPLWNTVTNVRSIVGAGSWVWTQGSNRLNELRVGYSHFYDSLLAADQTVNPQVYGINTGVTNTLYYGFPIIQIQPYPLSQFRLGAMWPKIQGPEGVLQILDHYSLLHGKHSFKFGGEFIANAFSGIITTDAKGYIKFGSLEDFLTGNPASSGSKILTGDPTRHLHNYQFAAFFQDDWRVTRKVTVNLGVRYEVDTVLKEANNLVGNFDPAQGLVQVGHGISSPYNGDHNNFAPRFGLAWDIQGNSKNVLRAGASVMYQQMPFAVFVAPGNGNGLFTIPTAAAIVQNGVTTPGNGTIAVTAVSVPGGSPTTAGSLAYNWVNNGSSTPLFGTTSANSIQCGDGLTSTTYPNDPPACNVAAIDRNLRNPYVTTWTLGIEHAFTNNLSLEVAYVGNHGSKLIGIQDINQAALGSAYPGFGSTDPTVNEVLSCNTAGNPGGFACDPGDADPGLLQAGRPYNGKFPYLGFINRISNLDQSNYHGLQVTFTQRATHGLSFEAGYTYAHALDDVSSTYQALIPQDSTHPGLQYGNTDFDIRHRFTFTGTYMLPGKAGYAQLLQGWQLSTVVTISSGAPWGAMDMGNDFSGTGDVNNNPTYGQGWNFVGNPNDFKSGRGVPISCWAGGGGAALGSCDITTASAPQACMSAATAMGVGAVNSLNDVGCYVSGSSVLIPPALGTFGAVGRNIFRDLGYRGWDLSLSKNTTIKERLTAQFRAEVFNILNHPTFGNPWGPYQYGTNDASTGASGSFGCACVTADTAASNPVLGSGGSRSIQLGLKLIF